MPILQMGKLEQRDQVTCPRTHSESVSQSVEVNFLVDSNLSLLIISAHDTQSTWVLEGRVPYKWID